MVSMGPYPCLFLLDANKATTEGDTRRKNTSNTTFCSIKLYAGFIEMANHSDAPH
jgi:hypothetical protein|tara:strand:- start:586 stop:750 length:165 start_codon:yes stop_codon:yes gene_type:complete